jgi:sulfur carrier protein
MTILVNGRPMDVPEGLTLEQLLAELKVRREYTAVALNREVAARTSYATRVLEDGDRVEIVHPMAGGAGGT